MIKFGNLAAQGDIVLRRVSRVPDGATSIEPRGGKHVVAHSETGHHHTIDAEGVRFFGTSDPLVCYLRVDCEHAELVHHRPVNPHESYGFGKGDVIEIRRQREWTPEGWRTVQD